MIIRAAIFRSAMFGLIWWVLAGGHPSSWTIGIPAIVLALLASLRLMPSAGVRVSLPGLFGFMYFFILNSMRSGFQIASLAMKPGLDMQPVILAYPLTLKHEDAQVFLAGTLSLLPGTVCLGLKNNCLFLHVIDRRMSIEEEVLSAEHSVAKMFREEIA